ncbi:ATP-binding protein, partial [Streptomyces europaeiscabiei]|nr:ATP-binding protein [Streptomyces europaeiscabiei]
DGPPRIQHTPNGGRRAEVHRGRQYHGRAGGQQGPGRGNGGPPPLPVRGARDERPNPAEAVPGVGPDDRRTVAEHTGTPPTPRVGGAVRGTMGRPQLPRRRAQQHIVPQLRGGPAPAPRQDPDHYIGHDPGLMAAFQRGIGLAEARQTESSDWDTSTLDTTAADLAPPAPDAASRIDTGQLNTGHLASASPGGTDALHMELAHMDAPHKDAAQPLGGHPRGVAPIAVPPASALDAAHDRTSRPDGSTPAG